MRALTGPANAAIASQTVPLCVLIEMELSTTLRLCLAGVNLEYGGHTWTGCGSVGTIDPILDTAGDRKGVRFTLSSVPNDLLALALAEPMQGKRVWVRLSIHDPSTYQVVHVEPMFSGTLEQPQISEGEASGTITVSAESRATTFGRPKPVRYIDSDQQRLYPGDTCLRFITSQAQHQDVWPSSKWGRQ